MSGVALHPPETETLKRLSKGLLSRSPKLDASILEMGATSTSATANLFSRAVAAVTPTPKQEVVVAVDKNMEIADDVKHLGGRVVRDAGPTRTVIVPPTAIADLAAIECVRSVRTPRHLMPKLDAVATLHDFARYRSLAGAGKRLGEGVVIGIVDTGVSGLHAALAGRLIECWDQTTKGKGVPGFEYGTLVKPSQSIDRSGHGTHVAGIAAGDDGQYGGVAPRAQLIAVRTDFVDTHVQDAISYVFARAAELKMPAVVNLSLGGHGDAHDGTDALDEHIDFESGPGRIVVAAAGNEGQDGIHTHVPLEAGETQTIGFRVPPLAACVALNIWYSGGEAEIAVSSPSGAGTEPRRPSDHDVGVFSLGASGRVIVSTPPRSLINNDHQARVTIDSSQNVEAGRWFLHVKATTAAVDLHAWSIDESGNGNEVTFSTPVNSHLIGAPGSASSAITASAYVSRNRWKTADGSEIGLPYAVGAVAPFSSPGPLRNAPARKPDFGAAGCTIVSSRSKTATYASTQLIDDEHVIMQGTSMACAVLSGLIATMLEEDGMLTAADVKARLRGSTRNVYQPADGYGLIML